MCIRDSSQGGDFKNNSSITNSGTIEVKGGTLNLQVGVTNAGGTIAVDSAAALTLNGAAIHGGTVTDNASIDVTGASTIDGTGTAAEAALNGVGAGSTVQLDAALTLDYVKLNDITIENGTTLTSGPLTIKDTVEVAGAVTLLNDTVTRCV